MNGRNQKYLDINIRRMHVTDSK